MIPFFDYHGNKLFFAGTSLKIFYLIYAFLFASIIVITIFRKQIKRRYDSKSFYVFSFFSEKTLWRIIALVALIFVILRSLILYFVGFPIRSEVLPLHFCRIMILFTIFICLIGKLDWIKYFGTLSIIAALIALSRPDFSFSIDQKSSKFFRIGLDSFFYWDYIFAHSFAVLCPIIIFTIKQPKITIKDTIYSIAFFGSVSVIMFGINVLTGLYAPRLWISNYWYLGFDKYNSQVNLFGPLSKWPIHLFTYWVLGSILIFTSNIIYGFTTLKSNETIKNNEKKPSVIKNFFIWEKRPKKLKQK